MSKKIYSIIPRVGIMPNVAPRKKRRNQPPEKQLKAVSIGLHKQRGRTKYFENFAIAVEIMLKKEFKKLSSEEKFSHLVKNRNFFLLSDTNKIPLEDRIGLLQKDLFDYIEYLKKEKT